MTTTKKEIEFNKIINEWTKRQVTKPSPLTYDIEELKQKLKEIKNG